ncbi:MAG: hypothetical protein QOE83_1114 [Actinomycetota bacterium]|jgi:hypothetical protein|nr:hypothetical protein [Actinomycetota bacterium]
MARRSIFAVITLVLVSTSTPSALAANTLSYHAHVTGAAEILSSTCPWYGPTPIEVVCSDYFVLYYQESRLIPHAGVNSMPARRVPWSLYVSEDRYVFHAPDVVEELSFRQGLLQGVPGSLDTARLLRASVAANVPMDDGSILSLDLHWDMSQAPLHVAGFDGPIDEAGIPWGTHTADRCSTANWLAHQIWREGGAITGSVNGVDASSLSFPALEPFMDKGQFTVILTDHGPSCPAA